MQTQPVIEIDHLLTYVRDLDHAATLFRRMGFTLSPISRIEGMGISNHLVLMHPGVPGAGNYIELMAAHDRARLPSVMAQTLSGGEGIKSMVLSAADAHAAQAAFVAQGFNADPPVHVKREWPIGPDESVFPEFDVLLPVDAPLVFNCCRYFNVELYLRPDWMEHANSARCLRSVLAVAAEPQRIVATFASVFGRPPIGGPDVVRVSPGAVDLVLMTPAALRERYGLDVSAPDQGARYIGYVIEVASLERLTACLAQGHVEQRSLGAAVCVGPDVGLGNLIVFEAGTS
ncbi:VOC family protein [Reyranella sp. CPCC 100927]|uniref:VOC family protein n=1 Tax=Reyranella sp. CPCC 100927 TaxID=2599616 RepID=UPI0011B4FE33|nr:VOC family protein [Reyranella sp. CPCC 100927]TWT10067.1 VOC family protein [Reyranella sp. CPCC 100927]